MAMDLDEGETGLLFPGWEPVRRRFRPDAPFFAAGTIERELIAKQLALDLSEDEKQFIIREMDVSESSELSCPVVGCRSHLKCLDDFEDHYKARHMASCSICSQVYPTSHLLSLHVSEAHDSFFQAKVAHGYPMYECLVESCGVKLKNYKSRQQHLVDKPNFPCSFEFFKKEKPSKKHREKVVRKQTSNNTEDDSNAMQVEEEGIEGLVSAVSRLTTSESPSSISFGRRHARGLAFVPRAVQKERKN